jgi:hypothetical protein
MPTTVRLMMHGAVSDQNNPPAPKVGSGGLPYFDFDQSVAEYLQWDTIQFPTNYDAGDITVNIVWGTTASTDDTKVVRWAVQVMAMTPETDPTTMLTDSYDTAQTVNDTVLGASAGRGHLAQITLSQTQADEIAANDYCSIQLYRDAGDAADTLEEDASLYAVWLEHGGT